MKVKIMPTMSWEEAPDTITPLDLSKILGIGVASSRKLFDSPDFPAISKKIVGNIGKADKEAVRLYLQGFNVKNNDKNALLMMIYQELKRSNNKHNLEFDNDEESEEI